MKSLITLVWLLTFPGFVNSCAQYRHKSEAEIAAMTPAQRVDEYANEQAYHKYDVLDDQSQLIAKYIRLDGLKSLPRVTQIIDGYNPTASRNVTEGARFDAMWMLLGELDNHVVRLRGSAEGRQAMTALERAIQRMRDAGYGRKDQHEWDVHGRFDLALMNLEEAKGIGSIDIAIKDTFWIRSKRQFSDRELLDFSNFLISRDSTYPSWSETDLTVDETRMNTAGVPLRVYVLKTPERFFAAYVEFKKSKEP